MHADLTVKQWMALERRVHTLILEAPSFDQDTQSHGPVDDRLFGPVYPSAVKALTYRYFMESLFWLHTDLMQQLNEGKFPAKPACEELNSATTVAALERVLNLNPILELIDDEGGLPPLVPVGSDKFVLKSAAELYASIAAQIKTELPELLGNNRQPLQGR